MSWHFGTALHQWDMMTQPAGDNNHHADSNNQWRDIISTDLKFIWSTGEPLKMINDYHVFIRIADLLIWRTHIDFCF